MIKNIFISGLTGIILGAGCMYLYNSASTEHTVNAASFNTSLALTQTTPGGVLEIGSGPYPVDFSEFKTKMEESDSCMLTKTYTKGVLFDATKMIAMLDAFIAQQSRLSNTDTDTLLVGVYPAYNCLTNSIRLYYAPVVMDKTQYLALSKGAKIPESYITDFRTEPSTSTFTDNVYNFGNEWPY